MRRMLALVLLVAACGKGADKQAANTPAPSPPKAAPEPAPGPPDAQPAMPAGPLYLTTVTLAPVKTPAKVDPKPLDDALAALHEKIEACYLARTVEVPALAGELELRFTVDDQGKATKFTPHGLADAGLAKCVEDLVAGLDLPPGPKRHGTPVTVKLTLARERVGGKVTIGDPDVGRAGLTALEVGGPLRAHDTAFVHCYGALLVRTPASRGNLPVDLKIDDHGKVTDVEIDEGFGDAAFHACVQKIVFTIPFPAPEGGGFVVANANLRFDPPL